MIELVPIQSAFIRSRGVCIGTMHDGITTAIAVDGMWYGTASCDDESHCAAAVEQAPGIAAELDAIGFDGVVPVDRIRDAR